MDINQNNNMGQETITESTSGPHQLSDREAEELRNMVAAGNYTGGDGKGLPPEYLAKIPAKSHNFMTIDSNTKEVQKMKEDAEKEAIEMAGNLATNEILSEGAEEHIQYEDFDIQVLDSYIDQIDSLSLLECVSLRNRIKPELVRLDSCKKMLNAVEELRDNFDFVEPGKEVTMLDRKGAGKNINKEIMAANYLEQYGFKEDKEEFLTFYDTYQPKFTQLISTLDDRIAAEKENANSTAYITKDMIRVLDKKIDAIKQQDPKAHPNKDYYLTRLTTVRKAFANRTDMFYLYNKFNMFFNNKSSVRQMARALKKGTYSDIGGRMRALFTESNLHGFYNILERCNYSIEEMVIFTYFLNRICISEAKTNNDVWVKILVLNFNDIFTGIYDLDVSADEYLSSFENLFSKNVAFIQTLGRVKKDIDGRIIHEIGKIISGMTIKTKEEDAEPTEDMNTEPANEIETVEAEEVKRDLIHHTDAPAIDVEFTEVK